MCPVCTRIKSNRSLNLDISKIGEFGLIDRLTKDIKPQQSSTLKGVGDDCAVLSYPDSRVLTTTDMLMEGVHFDLTYADLRNLGPEAPRLQECDGQHQRHLRHEWHTTPDSRQFGSKQAILGGRHRDIL